MARKNSYQEETKPWKATTKFFSTKRRYRLKIKEGTYRNTDNGRIADVQPTFLDIDDKNGYTPQNEEEENRLLEMEKKPGSYLIEYSRMPKSADAKALEKDLIDERKQRETLEDNYNKLKALATAAGIVVE